MEVEVTNPANSPMHYGDKPPVGVISAPDALPNRILYTNVSANKTYNDIQYDIYQTQKNHGKRVKKSQVKKSLLILCGITTVALAIAFRKDIASFGKNVFNKIKNIFTKKP